MLEKNASTTTTKRDGHNQPTTTCATKGPPNDHTNQRSHQQSRYHHGQRTLLSDELEEMQWPQHLNPTILPQFDGESDLKEFLLKYEATIEAAGGGTACKAKALVLDCEA